MATGEEKKIAGQLRQTRMNAIRRQPSGPEQAAEEMGEELEGVDTINSPGEARRVGAALRKKRGGVSSSLQTVGAKIGKALGNVQKKAAVVCRSLGGWLISLGAGLGLTLVGLVVGLPLILLGLMLFVFGILGAISGEAAVIASKAVESRVKAQKKKAGAKGGEGAIPFMGEGGGAMATAAKSMLRLILAPLKILFSFACGCFGGTFFLFAILVVIFLLVLDIGGGVVGTVVETARGVLGTAMEWVGL